MSFIFNEVSNVIGIIGESAVLTSIEVELRGLVT
jgi:hypothetical protein